MKYSDEIKRLAIADYKETRSIFKTAKRCGMGATTVARWLGDAGIELDGLDRYRSRIRKLPKEIVSDYESGMSASQIAEKYSATQASVIEALHKYKVKMRSRGNSVAVVSEDEIASIVRSYQELKSQAAVAKVHGRSQVVISRILRKAGFSTSKKSGSAHGSWKGGRVDAGRYVGVYVTSDDAMACMRSSVGYVLEHRLVMARHIGRPLSAFETVHHINGDTKDNAIANLQLRSGRHGKGVVMRCRKCGCSDFEYARIT